MKLIALYFALVAVLAVGLAQVGWVGRYFDLSRHGVETRGVVTKTTCSDHQTFRYRFEVAGRSFEAVGLEGTSKHCVALVPGDPVVVFYLPDDPSLNVSGNPRAHFLNEAVSIGLAVVVLPGFLVWAYARRRKRVVA